SRNPVNGTFPGSYDEGDMRRFVVGIVFLMAIVAWCAPAFAAEDEAGHGAHPKKYKAGVHVKNEKGREEEVKKEFDLAHESEEKELVRLLKAGQVVELEEDVKPDLFLIHRWDLGLWSIAIFLILFFLLAKFAWKPMLEGLTKREENIRSALDQAEKTRREALAQHEKLEAQM